MTNTESQDAVPPIEPGPLIDEVPRTRWPTVFGVISIIYAILGMTCAGAQGTWMAVMDFLPEMFRGGVTMPLGLRAAFLALTVLVLVCGVMLLIGGIGLVRRKRSSVPLLKKWAVFRLVLLLIGVVVTVLTAPAQIQMQKQAYQFQVKMMEEAGRTPPPPKSDDQIWHGLLIQTGIISAVVAVYPFTLGMFISRKKIADEVAEWR